MVVEGRYRVETCLQVMVWRISIQVESELISEQNINPLLLGFRDHVDGSMLTVSVRMPLRDQNHVALHIKEFPKSFYMDEV